MWALLLKCHFRVVVLKVPTNHPAHCSRGRPNFQLPSRPLVQSMLLLLEAFDLSNESFETLGLGPSQLTTLLKSYCPFKMIYRLYVESLHSCGISSFLPVVLHERKSSYRHLTTRPVT